MVVMKMETVKGRKRSTSLPWQLEVEKPHHKVLQVTLQLVSGLLCPSIQVLPFTMVRPPAPTQPQQLPLTTTCNTLGPTWVPITWAQMAPARQAASSLPAPGQANGNGTLVCSGPAGYFYLVGPLGPQLHALAASGPYQPHNLAGKAAFRSAASYRQCITASAWAIVIASSLVVPTYILGGAV
jgi:hypothetical protein